jgi:hypothetical protein
MEVEVAIAGLLAAALALLADSFSFFLGFKK